VSTRPEGPPPGFPAPRFRPGDRVRVKAEAPGGNPRTPRYVRGRRGVVSVVHGSMANPLDHRAVYPPLYTVAFEVGALFGGSADGILHVDVHEDWLEPG
jgi:hypothetical protein